MQVSSTREENANLKLVFQLIVAMRWSFSSYLNP